MNTSAIEPLAVTQADRRICADCFNDEAIKRFVRNVGEVGTCSFCDAVDFPTAPWEDVLFLIRESLETGWRTEPDDRIDWDWDDAPPHSSSLEDVLEAVGSPIKNRRVIEEIGNADGFGTWYDRYADGSEPFARLDNWGEFCRRILHKSRFFFYRPMAGDSAELEPEELPSVEVLDELAELVRDAGLVKASPEGERFFRARQHYPHEQLRTASELGPPPRAEMAQASRMSPAGIIMFYGATDANTACREVCDVQSFNQGKTQRTVGAFVTTQTLNVLNLTNGNIPQVPSIFDPEKRAIRSGILFLHRFVEEVARPITKDGIEHIEYVPTQVITEYMRHVFRDHNGHAVTGILYSSSKQRDGICCVFFLESDECGGDSEARLQARGERLKLDSHSIERFDLEIHSEPRFVRLRGV